MNARPHPSHGRDDEVQRKVYKYSRKNPCVVEAEECRYELDFIQVDMEKV